MKASQAGMQNSTGDVKSCKGGEAGRGQVTKGHGTKLRTLVFGEEQQLKVRNWRVG